MKKTLSILTIIFGLLLFTSLGHATSTETWGENFVSVVWTSAVSDWTCSKEIVPVRIFFTPSASGDIIIIREGSVTGPKLFKSTNVTGEVLNIPLFSSRRLQPWKPCIKATDQTWSTFGNVILTIQFE